MMLRRQGLLAGQGIARIECAAGDRVAERQIDLTGLGDLDADHLKPLG